MGPSFGLFTFLTTAAILLSIFLKAGPFKNGAIMFAFLLIVSGFYLLDATAIVNHKYSQVNRDDYIYGATKLFADFVACFMILVTIMKGGSE